MADPGLVFAFDTATDVAVLGIVDTARGEVVAEGEERPVALFARAQELLDTSGIAAAELNAVVVGVGPGRYTSMRIGLASAKGMAAALGIPIAGVSTLAALAAGAPGAIALIDARRGEVFAEDASAGGIPSCVAPAELRVDQRVCIGDGAIAYRAELEAAGAVVPGDHEPQHRVSVARLAQLATLYGPAAELEPVYLCAPDAERTRKEFRRA